MEKIEERRAYAYIPVKVEGEWIWRKPFIKVWRYGLYSHTTCSNSGILLQNEHITTEMRWQWRVIGKKKSPS